MVATLFTHIVNTVRADSALQLLIYIIPSLILLDILAEAVYALRMRLFFFNAIAHFGSDNLLKYLVILTAPIPAILAGVNIQVAIDAQKGAMLVLVIALLANIATSLQEITGIPLAFWEQYLERGLETVTQQDINNDGKIGHAHTDTVVEPAPRVSTTESH